MRLDADPEVFASYLEVAARFWRHSVLPAGADDPVIVVELFPEDLRVALRNLTLANAIRRCTSARVVAVTGTVPGWHTTVWPDFDLDRMRAMAAAFGVSEVVDIATLLDGPKRGGSGIVGSGISGSAKVGSGNAGSARGGAGNAASGISGSGFDVTATVNATALRLWRAPRLRPGQTTSAPYQELHQRAQLLAAGLAALFRERSPIALITSHVDYDLWGLAVETARSFDVPVMHVQQTGGLKAYTLWPERDRYEGSFRAEVTRQIGELFERLVWPLRADIRCSAELVVHRSKYNLGRPSWWRSTANAWVELDNPIQRSQLRRHVAARFGWDPDVPVVTVFNHAVSDALGTNLEVFDDLAAWYERTAEHASSVRTVNWLFLDHPAQVRYDETGFFDRLAETYAGHPHLAFRPSEAMSKNAIWSLTDLGVTVRGSVSNELPAYGIPVLQAGWSEWSSCGLGLVASDEAEYWRLLADCLDRLRRDEPVVTAEQTERARLWMWFYRAAGDVFSPLLPHWENLTGDELLTSLQVTMRQVESDGDPMFAAVRRMWTRREPLLTGWDLTSPTDTIAAVLPAAALTTAALPAAALPAAGPPTVGPSTAASQNAGPRTAGRPAAVR